MPFSRLEIIILFLFFVVNLSLCAQDHRSLQKIDSLRSIVDSLSYRGDSTTHSKLSFYQNIKIERIHYLKHPALDGANLSDSLSSSVLKVNQWNTSSIDSMLNHSGDLQNLIQQYSREVEIPNKSQSDFLASFERLRPLNTTSGLNTQVNIDLSGAKVSDLSSALPTEKYSSEIQKIESKVEDVLEFKIDSTQIKKSKDLALEKGNSIVEEKFTSADPSLNEIKKNQSKVDEAKKKIDGIGRLNTDSLKLDTNQFSDLLLEQENKIKDDIEEMRKIQLKYKNFSDSRFLPKHPPNPMRGKPWIERLIPGVTLQIFNLDDLYIDASPFVGYRFNGFVNAGVGGYRRMMFKKDKDQISNIDYYGIRSFLTLKAMDNFMIYTEVEYFRNLTNRKIAFASSFPDWQVKWNFGIQKRYRLTERIFGHTIVMYDLVKIRRFPNTEGSSVRFGFDYQVKKKKKVNS